MTLELKATSRTVPTPAKNQLRISGKVPAELYGHGQKNQHLLVDLAEYQALLKETVGTTLIDLVIDTQSPIKVLIGEVQHEPVSGKVQHLDFHQVKMNEEITAKVPLVFTGTSKAVKELGGTLIKSLTELEIKCLPANLINQLQVDLSVLEVLDQTIHVKDLKIPGNVHLLNDLEQVVASVKAKVVIVETPTTPKEGEAEAGEAGEAEAGEAATSTDVSKEEKAKEEPKEKSE